MEVLLESAQTQAGRPIISEDSAAEVENYKNSANPVRTDDSFAVNFADNTYVLAREVQQAGYTTAVIRQAYAGYIQFTRFKVLHVAGL